jgi:hypothetical protein
MDIQLEKLISNCNNPIVLNQIRDIFNKAEKKKSSLQNKIEKDNK